MPFSPHKDSPEYMPHHFLAVAKESVESPLPPPVLENEQPSPVPVAEEQPLLPPPGPPDLTTLMPHTQVQDIARYMPHHFLAAASKAEVAVAPVAQSEAGVAEQEPEQVDAGDMGLKIDPDAKPLEPMQYTQQGGESIWQLKAKLFFQLVKRKLLCA